MSPRVAYSFSSATISAATAHACSNQFGSIHHFEELIASKPAAVRLRDFAGVEQIRKLAGRTWPVAARAACQCGATRHDIN